MWSENLNKSVTAPKSNGGIYQLYIMNDTDKKLVIEARTKYLRNKNKVPEEITADDAFENGKYSEAAIHYGLASYRYLAEGKIGKEKEMLKKQEETWKKQNGR